MEFLKGEEDISSASWKFFVVSAEGVEQVGTRTGVRGDYVYAFVVAVADSVAFSNVPSIPRYGRLVAIPRGRN